MGFSEYLEKVGGAEKLLQLKADPILGYNPKIRRDKPFR